MTFSYAYKCLLFVSALVFVPHVLAAQTTGVVAPKVNFSSVQKVWGFKYPDRKYPGGIESFKFRNYADFGLRAKAAKVRNYSGFRLRTQNDAFRSGRTGASRGTSMRAYKGFRSLSPRLGR